MVDEKGLDPEVADRIGHYVKFNGEFSMRDLRVTGFQSKRNGNIPVVVFFLFFLTFRAQFIIK